MTYFLSGDENIAFLWTFQETWDLVPFKCKFDAILMVHDTTKTVAYKHNATQK